MTAPGASPPEPERRDARASVIAIVGVCAAGKTTLARTLREHGINARPILQEHSYVPTMWLRFTRPAVLIYLAADLAAVRIRRRDPEFPLWLFEQELERLRHARVHCDIYIDTVPLTPGEVAARALGELRRLGYA